MNFFIEEIFKNNEEICIVDFLDIDFVFSEKEGLKKRKRNVLVEKN